MISLNPQIAMQSEGWELIDARITREGDTEVAFTGLHGDRDTAYKVFFLCHMSLIAGTPGEQHLRINDDSGANYDMVEVTIGGTGIGVTTNTNETQFDLSSASSTSEQVFGDITIQGRSGVTAGHAILNRNHTNGSGGGDMHPRAGRWESTDEVNKISIHSNLGLLPNGRFDANCIFELYRMGNK